MIKEIVIYVDRRGIVMTDPPEFQTILEACACNIGGETLYHIPDMWQRIPSFECVTVSGENWPRSIYT